MFQNMDIICNRGNSGHNDPLHVMFWGCVRVSMVFTCGEELAHSTTQSVWAHELRLNFVKINSRAWIFAQYQSDWSSYQSPHYFDCCKPNCSMPCTYVLERDVLTDQWLSEISSIGCLLAYKEFRALVYVRLRCNICWKAYYVLLLNTSWTSGMGNGVIHGWHHPIIMFVMISGFGTP